MAENPSGIGEDPSQVPPPHLRQDPCRICGRTGPEERLDATLPTRLTPQSPQPPACQFVRRALPYRAKALYARMLQAIGAWINSPAASLLSKLPDLSFMLSPTFDRRRIDGLC